MTESLPAEQLTPEMAASAVRMAGPVSDAAALVIRYIEERAQQDDQAELLVLVGELLRQIGELQAELATLREAAQRNEELQRKYDQLKAREEELQMTVRRLEIGFRRHISERISPEQLGLALAAQATESEEPPPADSDPELTVGSDNGDPEGRDKPPSKKNRHQHGRRRGKHIPQIVIEVVPEEVRQGGLANYIRIGTEDSTVIGHRRGGPVEVVIRRIQYKRVDASKSATDPCESSDGTDSPVVDEAATDSLVGPAAPAASAMDSRVSGSVAEHGSGKPTEDTLAGATALSAPVLPMDSGVEVGATPDTSAPIGSDELISSTSTSTPPPTACCSVQAGSVGSSPAPSATSDRTGHDVIPAQAAMETGGPLASSDRPAPTETAGEVVVQLHEMLMVPKDPSFKQSPFVDGAMVWYTPPTRHGWADLDHPPTILSAPVFERPMERGSADASLIAHVFTHKHDYHTPYYRLEKEFTRLGWTISRTCMARWQYECGKVLKRITDAMWQDALKRSWFAMDATGTAIREKQENRYGHVFVLVAPGDSVLFRFTPKYDKATMLELFGGYLGTIVADASANHNILFGPGKGREGGCWAHARRPLAKAFKQSEGAVPAKGLKMIQSLFDIETEAALCTPEGRLRIRQERSAPIVDSFFAWVEEQLPLAPKDSWTRKGLKYAHNQKDPLREFLSNGEIPISNNLSERALRRIVKGRMNWQAHGSNEHAESACAIASLTASCEMHGLDPEFYLQEVLTVVPTYPLKDILDLSPKHWVATRQRLIAEGRLKYLDFAQLFSSRLAFRPP
ncbi:IS66 family transposase [Myxococcota bacterium]